DSGTFDSKRAKDEEGGKSSFLATTPHRPPILLHSPLGSSSRPPGRNLLQFTATHSMLSMHNPQLHTCQITIMP
ncbi:tRNA-specific 2-thiouridylase MnmA, partial [Dissostichus eleginoides]